MAMHMPLMVRPRTHCGRPEAVGRFNGDLNDLRLALVRVRAVNCKRVLHLHLSSASSKPETHQLARPRSRALHAPNTACCNNHCCLNTRSAAAARITPSPSLALHVLPAGHTALARLQLRTRRTPLALLLLSQATPPLAHPAFSLRPPRTRHSTAPQHSTARRSTLLVCVSPTTHIAYRCLATHHPPPPPPLLHLHHHRCLGLLAACVPLHLPARLSVCAATCILHPATRIQLRAHTCTPA